MDTGGRPLSVLLADDSTIVRERLRALLGEVPGVSIVAETEDVPGTMEAVRRLCPAVVVLDLAMPGGSGLEVLRQMAKERLPGAVYVLTNHAEPEYQRKVRALGAKAFLNKSTEFMKIVALVRECVSQPGNQTHEDYPGC